MPDICVTEEEAGALADFFPRVEVANHVVQGSAACRALRKLCPTVLPWYMREDGREPPS